MLLLFIGNINIIYASILNPLQSGKKSSTVNSGRFGPWEPRFSHTILCIIRLNRAPVYPRWHGANKKVTPCQSGPGSIKFEPPLSRKQKYILFTMMAGWLFFARARWMAEFVRHVKRNPTRLNSSWVIIRSPKITSCRIQWGTIVSLYPSPSREY